MTTINEIAKLAVSNPKNITKANMNVLFSRIIEDERLVELLFSEPETRYFLVDGYSYFRLPAPKLPKTWLDIFARVVAKKDVRPFLNYIYVDEENIVACNGHRMVVRPNKENYESGFYDKYMTKVDCEYTYPDYKWVMYGKDDTLIDCVADYDSNVEIKANSKTGRTDLYITLPNNTKVAIDAKYINDLISKNTNFEFKGRDGDCSIKFKIDDMDIMIMPLRQ